MGMNYIIFSGICGFVGLFTLGLIVSRLYHRASKEVSFVRTGFGGQRVIMNGGALVFPVLHETIPVNMNTLRLEVRRANEQALITRDRMRVDVEAEFYVRVKPTVEAIADAAQTLGRKTLNPHELKTLVEGKFVDALRSVAAEMAMEELHEQRTQFVNKVQMAVSEDLLKNGLELESVSLTALDQTGKEFLNPDNAFDAQGLTKLTEEIQNRRKQRNDIEQDTEVKIRQKNLEAERVKLELAREEEYARLEQQRELENRRAQQAADIARQKADQERQAREAQILAQQEVERKKLEMEQSVKEREILKVRSVEQAEVERTKTIELAKQDLAIAVAQRSKAQSEAQAVADKARALAVKAEEEVVTVRERERAERQKQIELVQAAKDAEKEAIDITVAADAEKRAARDKSEAQTLIAQGDAEAERLRAAGSEARYAVDAAGQRALNEAANTLSIEQIAMQVKLEIVKSLPEIIRESVRPMERIDGIKIVQVEGLRSDGGVNGSDGGGQPTGAQGNLADQVVSSALRYRAQQPLIDSLLGEVGLGSSGLQDFTRSLTGDIGNGVSRGGKDHGVSGNGSV
jgi:uncharacterized membrane protein YqiK